MTRINLQINIQNGEHRFLPLERYISACCMWERLLFVLRTAQNAKAKHVGMIQNFRCYSNH